MAAGFGAPLIFNDPGVGAFGNWVLAAWQLALRAPNADRYAVFQDDVLACKGLRTYLEKSPYPDKGYLNLYLMDGTISKEGVSWGWLPAHPQERGKGAQGLVFNNDALHALLAQQYLVDHPKAVRSPTSNLDGAVTTALANAGWREWVHYPSLLQHMNEGTTIISNRGNHDHTAPTFPGEGVDIGELIKGATTT